MKSQSGAALLAVAWVMLAGCSKPEEEADTARPERVAGAASTGVTMAADAAARLGLVTAPLATASLTPQVPALGTIVDPQPLFQRLSDLEVATAALDASAAALSRAEMLFADNGNASAQELESARSQQRQDATRVMLLQRQLLTEWGGPLGGADAASIADTLAKGRTALLRIELQAPNAESFEPVAASFTLPGTDKTMVLNKPWSAPSANPLRPGPAWFAIAPAAGSLRPGMRGTVQLTRNAAALAGVGVPVAAVVYSDSAAWVYVVRAAGRYERVAVDLSRPQGDGYFIDKDLTAGDEVVVKGAGLLLAEELGAGDSEE
ncbi:MAG: hypothetical protein ABL964_15720 [Steroidobacteraceae bacterium]